MRQLRAWHVETGVDFCGACFTMAPDAGFAAELKNRDARRSHIRPAIRDEQAMSTKQQESP